LQIKENLEAESGVNFFSWLGHREELKTLFAPVCSRFTSEWPSEQAFTSVLLLSDET